MTSKFYRKTMLGKPSDAGGGRLSL